MLSLRLALDGTDAREVEDPSGEHRVVEHTDVELIDGEGGRFGRCARFNGASSMITVAGLRCPPHFTFSVWVRRGAELSFYYATILAFGRDEPYFGLYRGRPTLGNSLALPVELGASFSHLAVTQDASGSKIYVNGDLMGASSSMASTGGVGLGIGRDLGRGRAFFQGDLADLQIFDEALSEVAIRALMEAPRPEPVEPIEPVELVELVEPVERWLRHKLLETVDHTLHHAARLLRR